MGKRWLVVVVALVVGVAAVVWCRQPAHTTAAASFAAPGTSPASPVSPTPPAPAEESPRPAAPRTETSEPDLRAAVARAAETGSGVDLGLAVLDLGTGAAASSGGDTPFHSASLSKLLVAVDMLTSGEVPQDDLDRLAQALSLSDDEAMNELWTVHDGMGAVERVAEEAGLTATNAPEDASQWGDVETSANDVVRLYRHVLTDLPTAARDFIVDALSSASSTAADGFDQAYGLLSPGVDGYAKQGWMWYLPDDFYLHSAGVVGGRYAIAALSVQTGVDEQEAKDRLTDVTTALISGLTDQTG